MVADDRYIRDRAAGVLGVRKDCMKLRATDNNDERQGDEIYMSRSTMHEKGANSRPSHGAGFRESARGAAVAALAGRGSDKIR